MSSFNDIGKHNVRNSRMDPLNDVGFPGENAETLKY